jgi:hypothetical protein
MNDKFPIAQHFLKYFQKHGRKKVKMWAIKYKNIPHIGQDTNATIESYHGNLKFILTSFKQCFTIRCID